MNAEKRYIKNGWFKEPENGGEPYLIGSQCQTCGTTVFPKRNICPACVTKTMEQIGMGTKGKLQSFATMYQAPEGFEAPYTLGFVDLEEGMTIFTMIEAAPDEELKIGQDVQLVIDKVKTDPDGVPVYGWKYSP